MLQIKRAGHSTLTTPDIGRMVDYFARIVGLSLVARDKDRAILATKSGLEAIALERGDAGEAPRLSFQIAPASDLTAIAERLSQAGIKCERRHDITPGIREVLAFKDPKGHHARNLFRLQLRYRRRHFHRRHAAQTGPHRLYLSRCRRHGEVLLRSPRLSRFRLAQRFLRVSALQPRSSH